MTTETDGSARDTFPREQFTALLRRLPRYGRLAWNLSRDPRLSRIRRMAVMAGAAYVISPIDLVPGIIPVAGQLDDVAVALVAIRIALDGLKPEVRAERLASVGLAPDDLGADIRTTRDIAAWLGRTGWRSVQRAGAAIADAGQRLGESAHDASHELRRATSEARTAAGQRRAREAVTAAVDGLRERMARG